MTRNQLGTIIIFAARYAHNRPTGASYPVCRVIIAEWNNMSRCDQIQLQRESLDATCNDKDWAEIRNLTLKNHD
jgi:hypothetical protein